MLPLIASCVIGAVVGFLVGSYDVGNVVCTSILVGSIISIPLAFVIYSFKELLARAIDLTKDSFTTVLILLILGFGASVGTGIIAGFLNPFIFLALTVTSLPAFSMLLYSPLKRRRLITKYRQSEKSLIKP